MISRVYDVGFVNICSSFCYDDTIHPNGTTLALQCAQEEAEGDKEQAQQEKKKTAHR